MARPQPTQPFGGPVVKRVARTFFGVALGSALAQAVTPGLANAAPFVELLTTEGRIVLELHPESAPLTVANFLAYVDDGFYDGTLVHRAIPGFAVQAGGYDAELNPRQTREPIDNEAPGCLKNRRGTVAMARSLEPRSTTSQFFVNLDDNKHLDYVRPQPGYEGYCAFATVVAGMDVVERMSRIPTGPAGVFASDVPLQPVTIARAQRGEPPMIAALEPSGPADANPPKKAVSGPTMVRRPGKRADTLAANRPNPTTKDPR